MACNTFWVAQMDTRNPMLASPSVRVVLGVGLLMSYEGMGTGLLECVRGCHCPVVHLDCHWDKPMSIKARPRSAQSSCLSSPPMLYSACC